MLVRDPQRPDAHVARGSARRRSAPRDPVRRSRGAPAASAFPGAPRPAPAARALLPARRAASPATDSQPSSTMCRFPTRCRLQDRDWERRVLPDAALERSAAYVGRGEAMARFAA